ncbi:aminotransferase class I/II-fold pyridoxal phosphate-dependent enzyme [Parasphaerochaeta coccoides]|uniref:Aminotransferase class I and II n=1 Tax=Parasphaerochaeta coccoides (strain ATCC BAA-1237 / DSM 17374 / SPN1) TaxID=760011 RepID=F4GKM9_PARC1|nr:aminotransferase class I/II-fold pyridoxal phosphate-dependent enzyme [Parasphaerochaeta coccoides]AEC01438.1 aminotransferase class I and II [Parasphaerochaeta coccoides DSM 17374]
MNPLARTLNETLEGTSAYVLLSSYGRHMFTPKGIIAQSAEAKQKAHAINATIGIATAEGLPMFLPAIRSRFSPDVSLGDVFPYAPTMGLPELRKLWKEDLINKNPSLQGKSFSLPLVVSGLTHAISSIGSLFIDEGDTVLMPDYYWDNYSMVLEEQRRANIVLFSFYDEQGGFNLKGLDAVLADHAGKKVILLLNFPNNPTGYTPTTVEAAGITDILVRHAERGTTILAMIDDAYFGLVYEDGVERQSLFAYLVDAHENILAVKGDAATKELMVWGFRTGFITYGCKGMSEAQYDALLQKTGGAVRGTVSCSPTVSQAFIRDALKNPETATQRENNVKPLRERYMAMKAAIARQKPTDILIPLSFNSGYFMSFRFTGKAEKLRLHLLENYGIGTIALQEVLLRIAYSSVDVALIPLLVDTLYKAAAEVMDKG